MCTAHLRCVQLYKRNINLQLKINQNCMKLLSKTQNINEQTRNTF